MTWKEKIAAIVLTLVVMFFLGCIVVGAVQYPVDAAKAIGVICGGLLFIWSLWTFFMWLNNE